MILHKLNICYKRSKIKKDQYFFLWLCLLFYPKLRHLAHQLIIFCLVRSKQFYVTLQCWQICLCILFTILGNITIYSIVLYQDAINQSWILTLKTKEKKINVLQSWPLKESRIVWRSSLKRVPSLICHFMEYSSIQTLISIMEKISTAWLDEIACR